MTFTKQVLDKINNLLVSAIEKGNKPWRKSWSSIVVDNQAISGPVNLLSKTHYKGVNRLILGLHPSAVPVFMTFDQVKKAGGSVKKGASSLPIIFFAQKQAQQVPTPEMEEEENTTSTGFVLKHYNVFNITDTTLTLEALLASYETDKEVQCIEAVESVITDYVTREGIEVFTSTHANFYLPVRDQIHLVNIKQFTTEAHYYSTFLHEVVHSTGHEKRLNRLKLSADREEYAFEELVAETAACYLTNYLHIANDDLFDNSSAYLRSWLKALDSNPYFFYQAAKHAEKAVNYIINVP